MPIWPRCSRGKQRPSDTRSRRGRFPVGIRCPGDRQAWRRAAFQPNPLRVHRPASMRMRPRRLPRRGPFVAARPNRRRPSRWDARGSRRKIPSLAVLPVLPLHKPVWRKWPLDVLCLAMQFQSENRLPFSSNFSEYLSYPSRVNYYTRISILYPATFFHIYMQFRT